ncbi:RnhA2 [Desulforapulum autotrophicum HRM2]|uniref:ribonuclease H n=1 Tax=Desulforapulum autotrophicum (strain ATCC 43914 / DSM 3382 / VKM B-1955 / HRM2) TaxID=177437 RepID=C0QLK2_DESAH|nr:ribonuclease H [Desulforapulum autotrophicum]ACN16306.1 RnhA2 [Desulforapulum autotrophicum HRM2]
MTIVDELKQIQRQINALNNRAAQLLDQLTDPSAHSLPAPSLAVPGSDVEGEDVSAQESPGDNGVSISSDFPIFIYTDGACSGNPGPAGSGVVVIQNDIIVHEISESLGPATNNIAELTAIKLGIEFVKDHHETPVTLYTDSRYAIGILTMNWKAKANVELVESIRKLMKPFKRLKVVHVKGHSGHPGNERADLLAVRGSMA